MDRIGQAVEASGVCCPEQVADMCILAFDRGGDWRMVLADAVRADASERRALDIPDAVESWERPGFHGPAV